MSVAAPGVTERATGADISELLGLHTRGARLILAVYVASNLAFAASTAYVLDHPWASFLAVGWSPWAASW